MLCRSCRKHSYVSDMRRPALAAGEKVGRVSPLRRRVRDENAVRLGEIDYAVQGASRPHLIDFVRSEKATLVTPCAAMNMLRAEWYAQ